MKWSNHKNKLSLVMSVLIAAEAFSFTPVSSAETSDVNLLANGSFEAPVYSARGWYPVLDSDESIAWKTSATDHKIEIWAHSYNGVPAYDGDQHAELNAYQDSTLYQDVATTPGQVLVWHLAHRANRSGDELDVMKLQMGAPSDFTPTPGKTTLSVPEISGTNITYTKTTDSTGTSTLISPYSNSFTMSDGKTEWGNYTGYYIVPEGQTTTRFAFTAVSSAAPNAGNFLDNIFFGTAGSAPVATDVSITGAVQTGQTVTGSYTYSDDDGDVESVTGSVYQWYSGIESDGRDKTPIVGATGLTFTITDEYIGKYLFFEVTPKAQTGMPAGVAVVSSGLNVEENSLKINEPSGDTVTIRKPEIKGVAEAGSVVSVVIRDAEGNEVPNAGGPAIVDENGNWSFISGVDLENGEYVVEVTAQKEGKVSKKSKRIVVDTIAGELPQLASLGVNGPDGTPIGLSPVFSENTYDYTAYTATDSVYLTPALDEIAVLDPNAKIDFSLNDGPFTNADNGKDSDQLPLKEGKNTIVVKVTANGKETLYTLTIYRTSSNGGNNGNNGNNGSGGGGSTTVPTTPSTPTPTPTPTPEAPKGNLDVTLNGNDNPFATGTTSTSDGRTTTSVKVDQGKLIDALLKGTGQRLAIHSPNEGDMTSGGLTADTLKQLSDKGASLEISNLLSIYPVPASNMNLSAVAGHLGNAALNDIGVHIDIKRSAADLITAAKSKATAAGYELLVDPVDLNLSFSHDGQTVKAGQLDGYAPKYIALPEGIDPNRITTGVIVNPDGSVYHVPTVVTKINNRYFALINDLRSSGTYSVIWNPQDFNDVKNHWGKEDVNNIAARLDLKGNGDNTISPNRNVTRSEFAEIVVTGLGLMRSDAAQANFSDVLSSSWYAKAIAIANEFDIVRGYDDGNFYGNQEITREQGFAMIARAYRLIQSEDAAGQDTSVLSQYKDGASVSNWAKADVAQLIKAGIIRGNSLEILSPQTTMTRAEVTALIARLLKTTNLIDK